MTKVFAYCRVSGKSQIDGDGFPRQHAAIQEHAAANDLEVVRWFDEMAISGTTEWGDRPAWVEMCQALNGVNTIIIERLDRLARDLMVGEHIIADLRSRGVTLISTAEDDVDSQNPTRVLVRQILGAINAYDKSMIVLKMRGARQRIKAITGKCEGQKLYGDKPGETQVILRMIDLRNQGRSLQEITDGLNTDGVMTRSGSRWALGTVHKILSREPNAKV